MCNLFPLSLCLSLHAPHSIRIYLSQSKLMSEAFKGDVLFCTEVFDGVAAWVWGSPCYWTRPVRTTRKAQGGSHSPQNEVSDTEGGEMPCVHIVYYRSGTNTRPPKWDSIRRVSGAAIYSTETSDDPSLGDNRSWPVFLAAVFRLLVSLCRLWH